MTGEEFTALLEHAGYYDPVKAHDYYLRTRQLKGRQHGSRQPNSSVNGSNGSANGHNGVRLPPNPNPTAKELKHQADMRTAALLARIDRLKAVLAQLVAEAQKRSGVKAPSPKHTPATPSSKKQQTPTHHLTAKEKAAKKRYEQTHKKPPQQKATQSPTDKQLQNQIHELRLKILTVRLQLKRAVKNARVPSGGTGGSGRPPTQPRSK